jgi:uncharacterized protein
LSEKIEFEAPTWNKIYSLLLDQSQKLCRRGFKPDAIVGVSRGGWISARILSDLLDNPNLFSVKVESYLRIGESKSLPALTQVLSGDVVGKSVLVVDEVADSGGSLKLVTQHVRDRGAREVKSAVLFVKSCCAFRPDFFEAETACWVVFPWEIKETLREILNSHKTDVAPVEGELAKLAAAGVSKRLISRFLEEYSEAKTC